MLTAIWILIFNYLLAFQASNCCCLSAIISSTFAAFNDSMNSGSTVSGSTAPVSNDGIYCFHTFVH
ncbi:MAG: hypothetical protein J6F30_11495 [Cellulosilyticum sp.]|nr:hypothetical protein [Cellulosilyticum sp.]